MTNETMLDRRRALLLAAGMGLGSLFGTSTADLADAARKGKNKKRKNPRKSKKRKGKKSKKKGQSAGGKGKKVVKEALKHKGAKYKWGGASPKGFDCSGFTWYVFDRAAGKEIGRTVKAQYKHGKKVKNNSWKAGDVVFFKNTFEKGLSHCGIYIGGKEFIHAENERTGVVISNLGSGYYKDHYAGARRIA